MSPLVGIALLLAGPPAAAEDPHGLEFEARLGPGQLMGVNFESVQVRLEPGAGPGALRVDIAGLAHPLLGPLGRVRLACDPPEPREPACSGGTLAWWPAEGDRRDGRFRRTQAQLDVELGPMAIHLAWPRESVELRLEDMPLSWVPAELRGDLGLSVLEGRASVEILVGEDEWRGRGRVETLDFDTPDGLLAGAGVVLALEGEYRLSGNRFSLGVEHSAGELLAGPLYLPEPAGPVRLELDGALDPGGPLRVEGARLSDPAGLEIEFAGSWTPALEAWPEEFALTVEVPELDAIRERWLDSLAATFGLPGLGVAGRAELRAAGGAGGPREFDVRLESVSLVDGAGRFRVDDIAGEVEYRTGPLLEGAVEWADAAVHRIGLGPGRLVLESPMPGVLQLGEPLVVPVLDGAFVVERFEARDWLEAFPGVVMQARLEPLDLAALSRGLGWPELGGRLAGHFPGVRYADGTLAFIGDIEVEAFSGQIRVTGLEIERAFSTLPALAGEVFMERLDLEQVTGAFNFGRMEGLMSGRLTGLRLLDWQPAAFDAWFETHEDSPRRRISQRAVDDLSSLGGAGGALLSGTLLRFFEDFPYRKAAIGCRLANNICRMRGIRPHPDGGYYIVEGRLLPRLDIIGHNRLVDWPRLLAQLEAVTRAP